MSTEHKIGKREFWRLRKAIPKPGQLLTETRRRCSGGLVAAWILAATLAKFDAAAAARDELGGCGRRGGYLKGQRPTGKGLLA